jgi:hypothetical protein
MKQFFAHYSKWEDYKSGMFNVYFNGDYNKQIELSANLLKQPSLFYDVCKQLINDWIIASKVNLSNCQQNRRAWLGAAACCYNLGSPEFITRLAWSTLSDEEKNIANNIATKIIVEFETNTINYGKNLFDN